MSEDAFEKIIDSNKGKIYRLCRVYAQNPIEPEDIFQEIVFQAWKSFPKFKGKSSVSTWLYRIALNVAMGAKTKFSREKENLAQLDAIQFDDTEIDELKEQKIKALHACIYHLSAADKSVIVLFLEGLPYKEIAEVTGMSENHIAVKMKRARAKLFDCITTKISG